MATGTQALNNAPTTPTHTAAHRANSPASTPATAGDVGTRRYRLLLLTILLTAALVDLFFFTGFFSSDDIGYFGSADHIRTEGTAPEFTPLGTQAVLRATVIGWSMLVMWIFGPHVQTVACSFVVFHLLLIWSASLLGSRLFDRRVALVGAWLTATCPLFVTYSTTILPDIQMACCFVLSLYAFMRSYDPLGDKSSTASAWGWMLTAGLMSGLAYVAKESGLILLPFYFGLWLIYSRGRVWKTAIWVGSAYAIGVAVVFAAEFVLWSVLSQHAYVRMDWTVKELDDATRAHIARYTTNPLTRLASAGGRFNEFFHYIPVALRWALAGVPILFCVIRGRRYPVLALAVWSFAYLTWGTMRFNEYFPPSIKARYYIPVIPFLCIVAAFVAVAVMNRLTAPTSARKGVRIIKGLLIAAIIILPTTGLGVSNEYAGRLYRSENVHNCVAAFRFASEQGGDVPIVLSPYVERRMDSFFAERRPARVKPSDGLAFDNPTKLLELGEFYYISTRRPFAGFVPEHPLDVLINLNTKNVYLASAWRQALGRGVVCWYPSEPGRTLLVLPDLTVALTEVGWFEAPASRWHAIATIIGNSALTALEPVKESARSVGLIKVSVTPRPPSIERSRDEVSESMWNIDLLGDEDGWVIALPPGIDDRMATSGPDETPPTPVERVDDGFVLNFDAKAYAWFYPTPDWIQSDGALTGAGRYEVRLEALPFEKGAAELRFDVFADAECTRRLLRKRINVRKAATIFQLQSDSPVLYIKPAFKLSGRGRIEIRQFTVTRVDG